MNAIGWCDYTWNPVWGCSNNCGYCYARKMANRFGEKIAKKEIKRLEMQILCGLNKESVFKRLKNFEPTFILSNFEKKFPKKPSRIFINSMSDICFWEVKWVEIVLDKIKEYPQHKFLFLTKEPKIYFQYDFIYYNCWLGVTITNNNELSTYQDNLRMFKNRTFISLEPIQEEINIKIFDKESFRWLI